MATSAGVGNAHELISDCGNIARRRKLASSIHPMPSALERLTFIHTINSEASPVVAQPLHPF